MNLAGRWSRFWFASTPLARLGAFRILILCLALWDVILHAGTVFADAAAVGAGTLPRPWQPIFLFEVLGLQPVGPATAVWVFRALIAAIALGIAGLFTRTACLVVAVLFVYWTGLVYSFGKPHHDKIALTFALLALPLSPCGARLSFDSLRARMRRARTGDPMIVPQASAFAALPLRLTQVTIALGYFFAGASKLGIGGIEWFNGYTLQGIMLGHDSAWSLPFAQSLWLCRLLSVGLVAAQAAFPVVFLWPRLLWFFVPALTAFHLLTWQTMDTGPYLSLWFTMVAFLPLERVPAAVAGALARGPAPLRVLTALGCAATVAIVLYVFWLPLPAWTAALLLFPAAASWLCGRPRAKVALILDGGCRLCRRSLAVVAALDWAQRVQPCNALHWREVGRRFPGLREADCMRDLHVVDAGGRVTAGFDAWRALSWRLPLLLPLAPLLHLPPVAALGRRVYRRIADTRQRDGCGDELCAPGSARALRPRSLAGQREDAAG